MRRLGGGLAVGRLWVACGLSVGSVGGAGVMRASAASEPVGMSADCGERLRVNRGAGVGLANPRYFLAG